MTRTGSTDHRYEGILSRNQRGRTVVHVYATGSRVATSGSRRFPICNRTEKDCSRLRGTRGPRGEKYTIRFPQNFPPTAANQLKFDQRELNIIGHWSSASKMPERYDRSACANELLLRKTVIRRMRDGWAVAPAFRLPQTVFDTTRIGIDAELEYTKRF